VGKAVSVAQPQLKEQKKTPRTGQRVLKGNRCRCGGPKQLEAFQIRVRGRFGPRALVAQHLFERCFITHAVPGGKGERPPAATCKDRGKKRASPAASSIASTFSLCAALHP
jgi:hypothetical protein